VFGVGLCSVCGGGFSCKICEIGDGWVWSSAKFWTGVHSPSVVVPLCLVLYYFSILYYFYSAFILTTSDLNEIDFKKYIIFK
jgi:hypothetical protein